MKSLHNKWMMLPLSLCLLLVFSFCSKNDVLASNEDNGNIGNNGSMVSKAEGKEHLEMSYQKQSGIAIVRVKDRNGKVTTQKINM